MRDIVPYDAAVAEMAQEKMTREMIDAVNRRHRDAQTEKAALSVIYAIQKAQVAQNAQHTRDKAALYEQLREKDMELMAEKKKARSRACWRNIGREGLLMAACCGALKAMRMGLVKWNLALPLAVASLIGAAWLAGGLWHELRERRTDA